MERIEAIKEYAHENNVPIMKDDGIDFICDYIRNNKVKKILEIGSAIGYSAIRFALTNNDITVTTIEIDKNRYNDAIKNVASYNFSNRITLINADALEYDIPKTEQFDLIFIDAAKAQYTRFFEKYKKNLVTGGVIVSDNLSFHGMVEDLSLTHNYSTKKLIRKIKKYIVFLKRNMDFKTDFFEKGDGIAISKKREHTQDIFGVLSELNIPYKKQEHIAIFSEKDADKVTMELEGIEVKNLFMKDKKGHFVFISTALRKRADLKKLSKTYGFGHLAFCSPEELMQLLNITPGSVTPLCSMFDVDNNIRYFFDSSLKNNNVLVHPLRNTATISISFENLEKFMHHFGHDFTFID